MDAPFGALDAQTRTVMQEGRMRICSASRRTMLFITHAVEEAVYLSDRVIVMGRNGGEIVADIDIRNTRQFEDWTAHKRIEDVKDLVSFMELPDPHLQTPPGTGFGFLTGAKAALRRVGAEVIDQAVAVNRKRVGRLMRVNGVRGIGRRRGFTVTTQCNGNDSKAPDLVRRKFDADGPNQLWVADMICVPTWAGLHLPGRGAGRVQPGGGRRLRQRNGRELLRESRVLADRPQNRPREVADSSPMDRVCRAALPPLARLERTALA